jgi:serine/threonine protein kinase
VTDPTNRLSAALADRYLIERELGQGGMATVYLAHDVKHDRKVALKVLRPELSAILGAERFLAEIKTTANLEHPHILGLHDSGEADGTVFYVMPYVAGQSLRARLNGERQLPVDDAIQIAREVADALEYAHGHGIIHRDIKPENILLHGGHALVADFGIALAVSRSDGGTRMTETGMSLGTPHYMSPEQAMGEREITAKSDVYALGCVVYEMLVGEPPFAGPTAQAIIARVLTEEPRSLTLQRRTIPPHVEAAVQKALAKLPADRFGSAAQFSDALVNPHFVGTVGPAASVGTASRSAVPPFRRSVLVPALTAATAVATALAAWGWLRPTPAPTVHRYGLALPASEAPDPTYPTPLPSPDGSFLVYHGPMENGRPGIQLWIKRRDSYSATPISGTLGAQSFTLSPDGGWIAFVAGGQLKKLPIVGGAAITIASGQVAVARGVAWLDDGTVVVPADLGRSLVRLPAAGGTPTVVWRSDSLFVRSPTPIVGRRAVIFSACAPGSPCGLWGLDLRTDSAHLVMRGAEVGRYVPSGHLVYVQGDGTLLAVPFDLEHMEARGAPVPLADSVSVFSGTIAPNLSLSTSGTLVMRLGVGASSRAYEMVWVDRTGRDTPVDSSWTFQVTAFADNHGWALSPDGSRLAIGLNTDAGDDIWVKQLPRGPLSRISYDAAAEYRPRWSPDGRFITFASSREPVGLYQRRADGTGTDSLLCAGQVEEGTWSPDGRWLVLRGGAASAAAGGRDITGYRPGIDSAPVPVLATPFDEEAIALSPDGRWLAYQSDETGRTEVFVRPFPKTDAGKWQVSNGGGTAPLWARNGKELYYLSGGQNMMAVSVTAGATLQLGEPHVLFHVPDDLVSVQSAYYTPWDVAADGRFIMARLVGATGASETPLIVVENWFEELKAKTAK